MRVQMAAIPILANSSVSYPPWILLACVLGGGLLAVVFRATIRHLLSKPITLWFAKAFRSPWFHYRASTNGVILRDLVDCRHYLSCFFGWKRSGHIWLYRNDLRAFWRKEDFDAFYKAVVDRRENIAWVRILIEEGDFARVTKNQWGRIRGNFTHTPRLQRTVLYRTFKESEIKVKDREFDQYVSDEAFIFYARSTDLLAQDAICVHRRFDREKENPPDLRITLVAGRRNGEEEYPLKAFLGPSVAKRFQDLFDSPEDDHSWKSLYEESVARSK